MHILCHHIELSSILFFPFSSWLFFSFWVLGWNFQVWCCFFSVACDIYHNFTVPGVRIAWMGNLWGWGLTRSLHPWLDTTGRSFFSFLMSTPSCGFCGLSYSWFIYPWYCQWKWSNWLNNCANSFSLPCLYRFDGDGYVNFCCFAQDRI